MDKSGDGMISSSEVTEGFKQLQEGHGDFDPDQFHKIAENVSSTDAGNLRCNPKKGNFKCTCEAKNAKPLEHLIKFKDFLLCSVSL
jgi:hypothetical protein